MDLYIPISSLNFNKIISSESISPSMYYEKRNFGDKRFTRISSIDINGEYVLAFTKTINFKIEEGEIEEYPINIKIPKDLLCHADCLNEIEINNYITCYLISRIRILKEILFLLNLLNLRVYSFKGFVLNPRLDNTEVLCSLT